MKNKLQPYRKSINWQKLSRSLYFVKDVKKGEIISEKHIRSIRPGYGAHPKYKGKLIGIKSKKEYQMGIVLEWKSSFNKSVEN